MNPFYGNNMYVRRGMIDCCMFVIKRQYEDYKRIILRVEWYKLRNLKSMGLVERVTIYKSNMDGWKIVKCA